MRRYILLLSFSAVAAVHAVETALPTPREQSRYEPMMEQSPFVLATVTAAPAAPTESFAANWTLTGLAKLPDADGVSRDFVTVRSRDARISFSLYGDQVSKDAEVEGVSIASVEWSDKPRESTVTLKKGAEFAKVAFSQEAAAAPQMPGQFNRPGNPAGVRLPPPGAPGGPPLGMPATNVPRPPGVSNIPGQLNRPVLPRPAPTNLPGQQPGMPAAGPVPGLQQKPAPKVRVINSRP